MSAPTKPSKPLRLDPNDIENGPTQDELAEAALKRAKAAKKAKKREREAEAARLAERIRLAEETLARDESSLGLGTKTQWMVGGVIAVLIFQVVHSAEHVAQATYWLFNPTMPPWMSAWAMGATNGLAAMSGGTPALGMELLHLIGNGIFLGGLLLALRLPVHYRPPTMMKWLRLALIVQTAHFAEHALLTVSVAAAGKAVGLSTMFGLLTPGTPAAVGYRVAFHLIVNLVAVFFALKAALAVRDARMGRDASSTGDSAGTGRRLDRVGFAVLAAPVAGLVFLLPIFGSSTGHMAAAADPAAVVATVDGVEITNGELQAEIDMMMSLTGAPQLGTATEPGTEAPVGTEGMTEEQVSITALNQLVQTTLIEQGAADLGIVVTDADVETRKQALIASDFRSREAFDAFLASKNATEDYANTQVKSLLVQERVHDALTQGEVISPADVQTVFSVQYEGFPRGRQLLTETEELAKEFLSRIEGGQSFDQLILDESTDPRATVDNGYIGGIAEGAQVQDIVDAINTMADGEFRVVESQFGWHVLQRLAPPTLAEVEPEIRANLLLVRKANAGQAWLTEIRAAANVTLAPGYGVWDTQFGAVVPAP